MWIAHLNGEEVSFGNFVAVVFYFLSVSVNMPWNQLLQYDPFWAVNNLNICLIDLLQCSTH